MWTVTRNQIVLLWIGLWMGNGIWSGLDQIVSGRNLDHLISLNTELEQISSFTSQDNLRWKLGGDDTFTVKETRENIDYNILPKLVKVFRERCTNDHIFYKCEVVASIWRLVGVWCDMHFPNMLSSSTWTSRMDSLRNSNDYRNRIQVIVAA